MRDRTIINKRLDRVRVGLQRAANNEFVNSDYIYDLLERLKESLLDDIKTLKNK